MKEFAGIAIALFGVLIIIFRGDINVLLSLNFNLGDMIFVATAISWSVYSVMLKTPAFEGIPTIVLFTTIALMGAITLAPFTIVEIVYQDAFPTSLNAWGHISGIVVFSSLIAFTAFQYGVKTVGASLAGIFMYFLPVYGVGMAVFYLGETFHLFHLAGILTVSGGVILATIPLGLVRNYSWFKRRTGENDQPIEPRTGNFSSNQ
jgi:drug/metabolite transporter (DMT)-like permease